MIRAGFERQVGGGQTPRCPERGPPLLNSGAVRVTNFRSKMLADFERLGGGVKSAKTFRPKASKGVSRVSPGPVPTWVVVAPSGPGGGRTPIYIEPLDLGFNIDGCPVRDQNAQTPTWIILGSGRIQVNSRRRLLIPTTIWVSLVHPSMQGELFMLTCTMYRV